MNYRLITLLLVSAFAAHYSQAGLLQQGSADPYKPLYESSSEPPMNLLVLGRDHKLWYEAYNDASDLDDNTSIDPFRNPEVGYKGWQLLDNAKAAAKGNFRFDYYGLFDSYKCYDYTTSSVFVPAAFTTDKKCRNKWSGDYLNYLTTSRMDAIRRVLYGGTRSTDTATQTILERAYIPQDAHSWGKEYSSSDGYQIRDYTPLSQPSSGKRHLFVNTTNYTAAAAGVGTAPLLRYLTDRSERIWEWASKNAPVSGPSLNGTNATNLTVRVEACKTNLLESECKQYGSSFKPTGLLQQYGDSDSMRFGLLTGSYMNNLEGGVLRKQIGKFADEVDLSNGTFKATTNGIVKTLNGLRIQGVASSGSNNDGLTYDCSWYYAGKLLDNGKCGSWGNPLGEMMYEAVRYLAGETSPTAAYIAGMNAGNTDIDGGTAASSGSSGSGLGLPKVSTWTDPYEVETSNAKRWCARPYITLLADQNASFDGELPGSFFSNKGAQSIGGASLNVSTIADSIWGKEFGRSASKNINIGQSSNLSDFAPTAKAATSFSTIRGLPEEAAKQGTYYSASVAAFARNNKIAGKNAPAGIGKQPITTFAVAMSSPLPKIEIPFGSKMMQFIPMAKTVSSSSCNWTGVIDSTTIKGNKGQYQPTNQIVDYYIDTIANVPGYESIPTLNNGEPYYKFRINFEDVEYGADHDMDAIVEYEVKKIKNTNNVEIKLSTIFSGGCLIQHAGYVVNGSTKDGAYLIVRDRPDGSEVSPAYWMDDRKPSNLTGNLQDSTVAGSPTATRTYTISSGNSAVTEIKPPMWYAAKYGGFIDNDKTNESNYADNINQLDDEREWDADGDQTPDNYFLVTNPLRLKDQLNKAFARIDATARSAAPVGSAGGISTVTSLVRLYKTEYKADNWSGNLSAMALDRSNMGLNSTYWSAKDLLSTPASRMIYTYNPVYTNGNFGPQVFKSSDISKLSPIQQAALNKNAAGATDNQATNRVNYLRGEQYNEGSAAGKYRAREQVGTQSNYYGDILDSQPYSVNKPDPSYESSNNYSDWVASEAIQNRPNTVFYGGNDGMLHAINDAYDPASLAALPGAGKETFAYVPSFLYPKLSKLEAQDYGHQYYVNGQIAVADVYDNSSWKTLLVASAGFGGKGVFALNANKLSSLTEADKSTLVRWEFSSNDDVDMGYQTGNPLIAKMNDGQYYAIVANGYNSANGNAALFLLNTQGPESSGWTTNRMKKLAVTSTVIGAGFNGLSAASAVDLNNDGTADLIYAGDLHGNVWKFDVRGTSPSEWIVSLTGLPLFKAQAANGDPQPIVAAPALAMHPTKNTVKDDDADGIANNTDVVMLMVGTGKFLEQCDNLAVGCAGEAKTQSFYGLWDKDQVIASRSNLLEQRIGTYTAADVSQLNERLGLDGTAGKTALTLSDLATSRCILPRDKNTGEFGKCSDIGDFQQKSIDWDLDDWLGWRTDLPVTAERHAGTPRIAANMVLFNTLTPVTDEDNLCGFKANSSLMALNYASGNQSMQRFDVKTADGVIGAVPNVGQLLNEAMPNGSTTISGAKPAGVGDVRGFGKNYGAGKNIANGTNGSGGNVIIDCPPSAIGCSKVKAFRTVTPVSWREVIQ